MNAEIRLQQILRDLNPKLHDGDCVYCTLPSVQLSVLAPYCRCLVREGDDYAAILPRDLAERAGLEVADPVREISLRARANGDGGGLLALVSEEFLARGIAADFLSTPEGQHIFVAEELAQRAMQVLRGLGNRAQYL